MGVGVGVAGMSGQEELLLSDDGSWLSMAMVAALWARLWTIELQNSIVSVASSSVKLLPLGPPSSSINTMDSPAITKT